MSMRYIYVYALAVSCAPWPSQDIRSLQSFLALSKHPCISPSICIAHTIATLVHDECATYDPHPTPLVYAIHHTNIDSGNIVYRLTRTPA